MPAKKKNKNKNKKEYKLKLLNIIDYMHDKDYVNYPDFCEYIKRDKKLSSMPEYAKKRFYDFLDDIICLNNFHVHRNRMHNIKESPYDILFIFKDKSYVNILYMIDYIYYKEGYKFEQTVSLFCNYLDLSVDLTFHKNRNYLMRIYQEIIQDCECNKSDCSFLNNKIEEKVQKYFEIMTESLLYNSSNLDLDLKDDDGYSVLDYIKLVDKKYNTSYCDLINRIKDNILFFRSL